MAALDVLVFGVLRDHVAGNQLSVQLDLPATAEDVVAKIGEQYPRLRGMLEVTRLACNQAYVSDDAVVRAGDEVALIPPVSGG